MQAAVSLITLRNTAFQDEGLYLYAGRQIIRHWTGGPAPLDHYAFYFSGYPNVYPVVGGYLDRIGGLELARSFSLLCMLGVTAIVYSVTRRLLDHTAAVFAASLYAVTGVVLFLGRLATFDALCLFFIALGTYLAVRCAASNHARTAVLIGPVLVLAILTKYAALLFIPSVMSVLVCAAVMFRGWRAALGRAFLAMTAFAGTLYVAANAIDQAAFHALSGSTTDRATATNGPQWPLFTHTLRMGGVAFGLAIIGAIVLARQRRLRILSLILLGSSILPPMYHIYMHEPVSLDKHIAYGLFFAMPMVGFAISWLSGFDRPGVSSNRGYWLVGGLILVAIFALGLRQSHTLFANWANTSKLSYDLRTQLRDGTGRIMAEDVEVARFQAQDIAEDWQWNSFYYPNYVTRSGQRLEGDAALRAALDNRYYDLVELSFGNFPNKAFWLADQMARSRNYDLIATIPYENSYGKGHFYLWRSALVARHGRFTSLNQLRMHTWP
jgi:4-amino-4-deoxy-L-arabinose transferase-like glycosyltransferase